MTQQQWGQQPIQRPPGQPAWGQPQQAWGQPTPAWGQPVAQRPAPGYPAAPGPAPYQGQPGYPPSQPPRSGSPLKLVLLGLVAAIAVGFFAFSLVNFLSADETTGPEVLPTPEIGQTSAPPTGVPDPEFNPPELPAPKDPDEAARWLTDNALYAQSVQAPTNCTLGRVFSQSVTPQELQEHLNLLSGCLMMVWQKPLEQAGFVMPRPPVTVYSTPITTACGEMQTHNAFYCTLDQRIYYATDIYEIFHRNPQVVGNAFLPDNVMAHEFGHAIQGRTGIWISYAWLRSLAQEAAGLDLARRSETQADCLAGMFLNAVAQASQMTDAERAGILDIAFAGGDDQLSGNPDVVGDHGLGRSRRHWFETGMSNVQAAACNNWIAPADQVR